MENIENINGLTVDTVNCQRIVRYLGAFCDLLNRREKLVEHDTGDVSHESVTTWQTPVGVVERHYWTAGGGRERSGVDWRIVPVEEIAAAQKRFEAASRELAAARSELEMLVASPVSV